eukprot:CAMPEP_0197824618 /NCGR_PEP_ID=MMETSP1437-20131217/1837_1 /TAXON_ID=49252 ORGANISM="Eucampia antarctica, Strain CCMP1452" /NCGR_SAMPLE_ID=MMETSP1437 /ASSEMBLY_ACC=CAM_ASM_001096 /LENGTH=621 /DNA_ID=CAMNT_0043424311 /DNA_START=90 /DNA_END=1955 /DNA_ORIENTATION=+
MKFYNLAIFVLLGCAASSFTHAFVISPAKSLSDSSLRNYASFSSSHTSWKPHSSRQQKNQGSLSIDKKVVELPLLSLLASSKNSENDDEQQQQQLRIYNSLTRTKELFAPLCDNNDNDDKKVVTMYTCGPTVYDYAHVGNFRAFLTYDILKRVLKYFDYEVMHICNLTDVDDKIIARCDREGVSLVELTRKFEGLFMDDLEALNIQKAQGYPRATEHISEMVQMIQDLESRGLAYQSKEGSWYFAVNKKEGYGQQLINLDLDNMKPNASGMAGKQRNQSQSAQDADEYDADKEGARDFALWKAYKPEFDRDDATWDTDIGKGRPGWHLECSAMAKKYLGETIDIHCGGIDLKFPHHENEIAQSEGANDGKTFCNCWLHNGFVNIGDEKMSKSKGNFLTLRNACPKKDDVRAYRYLVVSSQYRNPLSFTTAAMGAAKGALKRIDSVLKNIDSALDGNATIEPNDKSNIVTTVQVQLTNFEVALRDDLAMPRASASLFAIIKAAESEFKRIKKAEKDEDESIIPLDLAGLKAVKDAMLKMDLVFGIFYDVPNPKEFDTNSADGECDEENLTIPDDILELVKSRTAAKDANDWTLADELRNRITELGFSIKDVKGGDPIISPVN